MTTSLCVTRVNSGQPKPQRRGVQSPPQQPNHRGGVERRGGGYHGLGGEGEVWQPCVIYRVADSPNEGANLVLLLRPLLTPLLLLLDGQVTDAGSRNVRLTNRLVSVQMRTHCLMGLTVRVHSPLPLQC